MFFSFDFCFWRCPKIKKNAAIKQELGDLTGPSWSLEVPLWAWRMELPGVIILRGEIHSTTFWPRPDKSIDRPKGRDMQERWREAEMSGWQGWTRGDVLTLQDKMCRWKRKWADMTFPFNSPEFLVRLRTRRVVVGFSRSFLLGWSRPTPTSSLLIWTKRWPSLSGNNSIDEITNAQSFQNTPNHLKVYVYV